MKTIQYIRAFAIVATIALFASCNKEWVAPEGYPATPVWTTTHTIQQLVTEFFDAKATSDAEFTNPSNMDPQYNGNFKLNKIVSDKDVIIEGIVVSTDVAGNIYKSLVIQDINDPAGQGLKISIDAGSLSGVFKYGQRLQVRCNGLVLGTYGQMIQLGTAVFNDDSNRQRWDPGRMPWAMASARIQPYGKIAPNKVQIPTMTIAQIKALTNADAIDRQKLFSRIVKIQNVWFTDQGVDFNKPATLLSDAVKIFAPSTNGLGFPQPRVIRDQAGPDTVEDQGWIAIATSEYAKFANDRLPVKGGPTSNVGTVTCIIGWYKDKTKNLGNWQLTIRSKDDLEGFTYPQ